MEKLRIDVWSDIACPWCYVGKRRLEGALSQFANRGATEIVWRAFELDPAAPRLREGEPSYAERLAKKYNSSLSSAIGMITKMTDVAKAEGLAFDFTNIRPGNTFDAHRVLSLALEHGLQDAVKERFLRGYMTEGEAIGLPEVLIRLGAEAGLDADQIRATVASDAHASHVRADEEQARELGIRGVPFFVIGGRYALSGAQPSEIILSALDHAWSELRARPVAVAEGAACGPDGCN